MAGGSIASAKVRVAPTAGLDRAEVARAGSNLELGAHVLDACVEVLGLGLEEFGPVRLALAALVADACRDSDAVGDQSCVVARLDKEAVRGRVGDARLLVGTFGAAGSEGQGSDQGKSCRHGATVSPDAARREWPGFWLGSSIPLHSKNFTDNGCESQRDVCSQGFATEAM